MRNILPAAFAILVSSSAAQAENLPWEGNGTGYKTVAAAHAALQADSHVVFSTKDGWAIGDDENTKTVWSFPPQGHPAYPSVVKRQIIEKDGKFMLKMNINCEAPKEQCAKLVLGFDHMNDMLAQQLNAAQR